MALKGCKECGEEVSTSAETCPHCGVKEPTTTWQEKASGCAILVLVAMGLLFWFAPSGGEKSDGPKEREQAQAEAKKEKQVKKKKRDKFVGELSVPVGPNFKLFDDTPLPKGVDALVELVRLNGYKCNYLDSLHPYVFSYGYTLRCNGRYRYEIEDKGGNWIVIVK